MVREYALFNALFKGLADTSVTYIDPVFREYVLYIIKSIYGTIHFATFDICLTPEFALTTNIGDRRTPFIVCVLLQTQEHL